MHLTDIRGNPHDIYVRGAACKIFLTLLVRYIDVYTYCIYICPSYYISSIFVISLLEDCCYVMLCKLSLCVYCVYVTYI